LKVWVFVVDILLFDLY